MSYFKYLAVVALVAPGAANALQIDPWDLSEANKLEAARDSKGTDADSDTLVGSATTRSLTFDYLSDVSSRTASFTNIFDGGWGWINNSGVESKATLAYTFSGGA